MERTKQSWLGLLLSVLSMVFFSAVYVFSKAALNQISLAQFGFYWFTLAMIENGIYFFAAGLHKQFVALSAKQRNIVFLISFFELIGTYLFFWAIDLYTNPAVVSFLATAIPIFVALLSYIFLKERFSFIEIVGIVITIFGAMLISYRSAVLKEITHVGLGLIIALIFGILFAINTVLIRSTVRDIHPVIITFIRSIFLSSFSLFLMLINKQSFVIPWKAAYNIILGATLGPFLGVLASIWALKYIEATISSTVINAKGFLVMLIAYFYLSIVPRPYQIIGGILTVAGVTLLSYGQHRRNKRLLELEQKLLDK